VCRAIQTSVERMGYYRANAAQQRVQRHAIRADAEKHECACVSHGSYLALQSQAASLRHVCSVLVVLAKGPSHMDDQQATHQYGLSTRPVSLLTVISVCIVCV